MPKEQIILESNDNHSVVMQTSHASIRGLTIRCQAGQESKQYHALDILQGQLFIEGGDLLIRYSKIRDSQQSGIHVYDGGQGTVEYCTLTGNADKALDIAPQCNVILRGNQT